MIEIAEKLLMLFLLFVYFSNVSAEVQFVGGSNTSSENYSSQVDTSMLSTSTILEHNKRLLNKTTIGTTLLKTSNMKAKNLYTRASRLYVSAVSKYHSGQMVSARELAFQSIRTLYLADRLHYNLP